VQPNEGRTRLHELQDKLSKDITDQAQAAVKAAAASSHATAGQQESRIQALEVGLQELKGHNVQFKQWFQQAGERLQQTENTMGAMQQTLNSHQHELHALGSTFQSTMKTVKEDLSTEMNESFNKQLSRLEALLEKKQRQA
jgi:predicted  nucleic acid-binding Zn-ribbon protein